MSSKDKFRAGKLIKTLDRAIKINKEALVEIKRTHEIFKEIHNKNKDEYYKITHEIAQEIKVTNPEITKIEANLREATQLIDQLTQQIENTEIQIRRLETLRYRILANLFT